MPGSGIQLTPLMPAEINVNCQLKGFQAQLTTPSSVSDGPAAFLESKHLRTEGFRTTENNRNERVCLVSGRATGTYFSGEGGGGKP